MDSEPFRPVPGRKFHVESEFGVKFSGIRRPGAKIWEKLPQRKILLNSFSLFCCFFSFGLALQPARACARGRPLGPGPRSGSQHPLYSGFGGSGWPFFFSFLFFTFFSLSLSLSSIALCAQGDMTCNPPASPRALSQSPKGRGRGTVQCTPFADRDIGFDSRLALGRKEISH